MAYHPGLSPARVPVLNETGRRAGGVARAALVAFLAILLSMSGVVVLRRVAGALVDPLSSGALLLAGVVLAILSAAAHGIASQYATQRGRAGDGYPLVRLLPTTAVLAFAISISVPGSRWIGLIGLWGLIGLAEGIAWLPSRHFRRPWKRVSLHFPRFPVKWLRLPTSRRPPLHSNDFGHRAGEELPPSDVVQRMTRRHLDGGAEELAGWVRVPFEGNQRTESVHVAFCPPFPMVPQLSVSQRDGPPARVKTALLLPYGARLDLKLSGPSDAPTTVRLEFVARTA